MAKVGRGGGNSMLCLGAGDALLTGECDAKYWTPPTLVFSFTTLRFLPIIEGLNLSFGNLQSHSYKTYDLYCKSVYVAMGQKFSSLVSLFLQ